MQKISSMYPSETVKKIVDERYEKMRTDFPRTARAAHYYILSMLSLRAPNKVPCFLGECAVDPIELDNLLYAFFMMSGMIEQKLNGNTSVTPISKEVMCRKYLGLPPLVIHGEA